MTLLEQFEKLDIAIIDNYRHTGHSDAISLKLQRYIIHLFRGLELFTLQGNIFQCARNLMREFKGEIKSFESARRIIYDAINHFNTSEPVKNEIWNNAYADKLDNIALLAIKNDDLKTAQSAIKEAHRIRTLTDENQIDPDKLKPPTFIITSDITHKKLGIENRSLKEISKKQKDGFYTKLIDQLPIEEDEKDALRKDADIQDVDYEEIED